MSEQNPNQAQADLWTASGPLWVELRDRFDAMAGPHGQAAMQALAPSAGERVADIGCGAGSAVIDLADAVGPSGAAVGVDISPTMIDGARQLAVDRGRANTEYVVADAMTDSFGSGFDAIYSRFGVMFFADSVAAFTNLRRSLRPGGRLAFACWQPAGRNAWVSVPLGLAGNYVELPFGTDPNAPGPFAFADAERVAGILTAAGFDDVNYSPCDAPVTVGTDLDDAADFLLGLSPPVRQLSVDDPDKAAALRADVLAEMTDWVGADGVQAASGSWTFSAVSPG